MIWKERNGVTIWKIFSHIRTCWQSTVSTVFWSHVPTIWLRWGKKFTITGYIWIHLIESFVCASSVISEHYFFQQMPRGSWHNHFNYLCAQPHHHQQELPSFWLHACPMDLWAPHKASWTVPHHHLSLQQVKVGWCTTRMNTPTHMDWQHQQFWNTLLTLILLLAVCLYDELPYLRRIWITLPI